MNTQLTPFWYRPEAQVDGQAIEFHLRPLTQPQMIDVEEHNRDGKETEKARWIAGTLGIIGVRGAVHPTTAEPAAVPSCFQWIDRGLIKLCGLRLIINDMGLDWDKLVAGAGDQPPKPEDGPAKN